MKAQFTDFSFICRNMKCGRHILMMFIKCFLVIFSIKILPRMIECGLICRLNSFVRMPWICEDLRTKLLIIIAIFLSS